MAPDLEYQLPTQENPASSRNCLYSLLSICFKALCKFIFAIFVVYIWAVFFSGVVLSVPFSVSIVMLIYSLPKKLKHKLFRLQPSANIGVYDLARQRPGLIGRILTSSGALFPRGSLILLVWLLVNISVPRLREIMFLGSPLHKWSLQGVTLTYAYFVALGLYLTPLICLMYLPGKPLRQYYYYHGLIPSGTFVIYCLIVLLSWLLYFRTDGGLNHASTPHREAFDYVTWTAVSLFVGSVLWLLKALLLLWWSVGAIYRRFEGRMLIAGVKYFYLGLLIDRISEQDIITQLRLEKRSQSIGVANYIVSRKMDLSHLVKLGDILTSLARIVRSRDEDGASAIIQWFNQEIGSTTLQSQENGALLLEKLLDRLTPTDDDKIKMSILSCIQTRVNPIYSKFKNLPVYAKIDKYFKELCNLRKVVVTERPSKEDLKKSRAELLKEIVVEEYSSPSKEYTYEALKKWMVDGHIECVNMGCTLGDAKAIVTRLDIFLSFIIVGAALLFWLLITGIATAKVLVTIATPILALTFLFGDNAKAFFQGLVFCFATHAFDVGDRCILDDTELEVKSISILTTTFVKIGTKEKRFYPNTVLAAKAIVNLGGHPDPSDVVELTLDPSADIENLEHLIVEFFGKNKSLYEQDRNLLKVLIKEVGDNITVSIHYKHILTVSESHNQCLLKKREQRSLFLKALKQFIAESKRKPGNDANDLAPSTSPSDQSTKSSTTSCIEELKNIQT